jgi:hypothetical protein
VSLTGAGTCVIDADQAGNADYDAAAEQQQSFTVVKPPSPTPSPSPTPAPPNPSPAPAPTPAPISSPIPGAAQITQIQTSQSTIVWCRGPGCRYPSARLSFDLNRPSRVRVLLYRPVHHRLVQVDKVILSGHAGHNRHRIPGRWHDHLTAPGPARLIVQQQRNGRWRTIKTINLTVRHTHHA